MSFVCNVCGRGFGNNVKSRDNYNVHLKLYGDQNMQERKLKNETKDIDPRATMLHYKDNLRKLQKAVKETEDTHRSHRYLDIDDAEDLLNPDLDSRCRCCCCCRNSIETR